MPAWEPKPEGSHAYDCGVSVEFPNLFCGDLPHHSSNEMEPASIGGLGF